MERGALLDILMEGLWHTTHPDRFEPRLDRGALLPEPDTPNTERCCTGSGPGHYPYVRHVGGIRLIDFARFDPEAYSKKYPLCTWYAFAPLRRKWRRAVWLEIDRVLTAERLISASDLLRVGNGMKPTVT